jgi:hypothetical protein
MSSAHHDTASLLGGMASPDKGVVLQLAKSVLAEVVGVPLPCRPTTAHWFAAGQESAAMADTPLGAAAVAHVVPPSLDR